MKFCCQDFVNKKNGNAISFSHEENGDIIIDYYPRTREYLTIHGEETACYIHYCPWCGVKLLESLSDEWWDILENEYKIDDPLGADRVKVPAEFWTEEWWKKRGL